MVCSGELRFTSSPDGSSTSRTVQLARIVRQLKDNRVDTICLNVPDSTFSDRTLMLFLREGILAHVGVDHADVTRLSQIYIGETDKLEFASSGAMF